MAFHAVTYTYIDDAERIGEVRPRHREFLASLASRGVLRASGPLAETSPPRALLLMMGSSPDDVRAVLRDDPFQIHGIVTSVDVVPWLPVIGCFADEVS